MNDRIMVKMTASEDWIIFRTVTKEKKSTSLYVRSDELLSLADRGRIIAQDHSFAVFARDMEEGTVNIWFYWVNMHGGDAFTGRLQCVKLPFEPFMEFVERSAFEGRPQKWSALSIESQPGPRFVFRSRRNLHDVCTDKLVRRKLSKFLRDRFRWNNCTEIIFTDDFVPYSFFFTEMRKGAAGICGGLILHGQENMEKAYYEIHT